MNNQQNCPWCNAKSWSTLDGYTCDSYFDDDKVLIQSADCREAEYIYKLVNKKVLDEREACVEVCKRLSKDRGCFVEEVLNEAVEAIRARGDLNDCS